MQTEPELLASDIQAFVSSQVRKATPAGSARKVGKDL
jgi:hypothetical protein